MTTTTQKKQTQPAEDRYWILKRLADSVGGLPVPSFYYAVMQFPSAKARQEVLDAARRLGLRDLTGQGTIRFAHKYGKKSFDRVEVYIHTRQDSADYGINNPMLTMDLYRGSELEPAPTITQFIM